MEIKERLVSNEIKRLIPVLGKENAEKLANAYLLGDEDTRKSIFETIDIIKAAVFSKQELRNSVLMEPPSKEQASEGDFQIGTVLYGKKKMYPMMFKKKSFLTHMGIFGSSGYGKTNISYWLIKNLSEQGVPVLIFDFSKRNYRDLLSTELKENIDVYTIGRRAAPFVFNPLKPPEGIQPSQWMKEFATIFDHAYWLLGGGRHIIMKALDKVHESKESPRITDLKNWLEEYGSTQLPTRERNWLATAERPLESLCFKEIGDVFNCNTGIRASDFFQEGKVTILELDALDVNDKTFFIEIMLQWIRDWLLVSNRREDLRGVIILEEAHHVLNRDKANKIGSETVIDLIFREVRELGIGMVYIDQHPSLVSYPALGNTSTQICMNLGLDTKHASDILDASHMLGLDYEDEGNYLRKLPVGHGFMMCRMSDFHDSFLVEFPFVELKKGSVTDDYVRQHMQGKIILEEPEEEKPLQERETSGLTEDSREPVRTEDIDDKGWRIIEALGKGKAAFTSQIYKELGISGTEFNRKVKRLMDMGVIRSKNAKVKKNKLCYYFLTEAGREIFSRDFGENIATKEADLRGLKETCSLVGWEYDEGRKRITFEDKGNIQEIAMRLDNDRESIYEDIRNDVRHYICASEPIRNTIIQEAARFSYKTGRPIDIFITTVKRFEEKGDFERIKFSRL